MIINELEDYDDEIKSAHQEIFMINMGDNHEVQVILSNNCGLPA